MAAGAGGKGTGKMSEQCNNSRACELPQGHAGMHRAGCCAWEGELNFTNGPAEPQGDAQAIAAKYFGTKGELRKQLALEIQAAEQRATREALEAAAVCAETGDIQHLGEGALRIKIAKAIRALSWVTTYACGPYSSFRNPVPADAPPSKPRKDANMKEIDLMQTTDHVVWAKEFVRRYGGDEELIASWFASAMMAKHDAMCGPPNGDAMQYFQDKALLGKPAPPQPERIAAPPTELIEPRDEQERNYGAQMYQMGRQHTQQEKLQQELAAQSRQQAVEPPKRTWWQAKKGAEPEEGK